MSRLPFRQQHEIDALAKKVLRPACDGCNPPAPNGVGLCSECLDKANSSSQSLLSGTAEIKTLLDAYETAILAYNFDQPGGLGISAPRVALEEYVEQLRHIGKTTREMYEQAEAELSRLRSTSLTPEEASKALNAVWSYDPAIGHPDYDSLREKLGQLRLAGRSTESGVPK